MAAKRKAAPKRIKNAIAAKSETMHNGFAEAILGPNGNNGSIGTQLNQVATIFRNNRWYLISNMRQVLSESYVEHGLIQTIVDVPVDDGLRGGVDIQSKQLDEQQIQDLQAEMEREDDINNMGQGLKWNRLFGGAGILVMTDQDPMTPLNMGAITEKSPLEFRAVDMWELFWDKQNTEGYDPTTQEHGFEFYSYYGLKVHKSRVMRLKGLVAPSFIRPRLRGWGFSVVEALVNSINQYLKSNNLTFEVLDEFKLDIFKIKNLANTLLSPDGDALVRKRVATANAQKNFQNAITMDSEDDYIQKQLSFTGLAEAMQGIRLQIASDMRMPLTKVFGISSAGFSSGEDDIENYNAMVESQVRTKAKFDILRMVELRCQRMFGMVPSDLQISFKPLRVLSAEQEENVKTQKFNRLFQAKQAGEINTLEFRDAINRGNLFDVKLDTDEASLNDIEFEQTNETVEEGSDDDNKKPKDDEPGANKFDTRKPQLNENKQLPLKVKNSIQFDRASYAADGGAAWMDPHRVSALVQLDHILKSPIWKEAISHAQGDSSFALWWFKKQGGKL